MLLLWDADLRSAPQATFDAVCAFAGLPRVNITAFPDGIDATIKTVIDAVFPAFERTGWKQNEKYPPLDAPLRRKLDAFFKPFNAALFEYLALTGMDPDKFPAW